MISARQIPQVATRCTNCHKFRYCNHTNPQTGVVCNDCIQTWRNQKILQLEITKQPKPITEPQPKQPRQPRQPRQPKPITEPKVIKEPKPKRKPSVFAIAYTRPGRPNFAQTRQEVLQLLIQEQKPFTTKGVAEIIQLKWRFIRTVLIDLVKSGLVIKNNKQRNSLYIYYEYEEKLEKYGNLHICNKENRTAIANALHSQDGLITPSDLLAILQGKIGRAAILGELQALVLDGKANCFYDRFDYKHKYGSKLNPKAVKAFEEAIANSIENRILRYLEDGKKYLQSIAEHLGYHRRCVKGTYKIILELQEQGRVQVVLNKRKEREVALIPFQE